jgi:hypothetical protein
VAELTTEPPHGYRARAVGRQQVSLRDESDRPRDVIASDSRPPESYILVDCSWLGGPNSGSFPHGFALFGTSNESAKKASSPHERGTRFAAHTSRSRVLEACRGSLLWRVLDLLVDVLAAARHSVAVYLNMTEQAESD